MEDSVKRIVSEGMNSLKNVFLTQIDSLFSAKLRAFDSLQKERSDSPFSRLQNEILLADEYKIERKSCEDQHKFNQKVLVTF